MLPAPAPAPAQRVSVHTISPLPHRHHSASAASGTITSGPHEPCSWTRHHIAGVITLMRQRPEHHTCMLAQRMLCRPLRALSERQTDGRHVQGRRAAAASNSVRVVSCHAHKHRQPSWASYKTTRRARARTLPILPSWHPKALSSAPALPPISFYATKQKEECCQPDAQFSFCNPRTSIRDKQQQQLTKQQAASSKQ